MGKANFSPALLVGVGETGIRILEETEYLLKGWPKEIINLIQLVKIDHTTANTRQRLAEAIEILKSANLLAEVEEKHALNLRQEQGPLEIKVFLLGRLGCAPAGLSLDVVLEELLFADYAWPQKLGYTGATIVTLALMGGFDTSQRIVLNRMLASYRNDSFLDCFAGRLFLIDKHLKDGSKVEWQELYAALAKSVYLSIIPSDESLLGYELGLIRKHEREAKLAALGLTVFYYPSKERLFRQAATKLTEILEAKSQTVFESQLLKLLEQHPLDLLEEKSKKGKETPNLITVLNREVEGILTNHTLQTGMAYLEQVIEKIEAKQKAMLSLIESQEHEAMPLPKEANLSPFLKPKGPRVSLILGMLLLGLALLYRLSSMQLIKPWLSWLLGILMLFLVSGILVITTLPPIDPDLTTHQRKVRYREKPGEVNKSIMIKSALLGLEDLLQEGRILRQRLLSLQQILRSSLRELSSEPGKVLNRPVDDHGGNSIPQLDSAWYLHPAWKALNGEEYRQWLMERIVTLSEGTLPEGGTAKHILEAWCHNNQSLKPSPLLVFSQNLDTLKHVSLLSVPPRLREGHIPGSDRKVLKGDADMLCAMDLYFGLDSESVLLDKA